MIRFFMTQIIFMCAFSLSAQASVCTYYLLLDGSQKQPRYSCNGSQEEWMVPRQDWSPQRQLSHDLNYIQEIHSVRLLDCKPIMNTNGITVGAYECLFSNK